MFGYLFIGLFLLVFGVCSFVWGWWRRSRRAKWIGGTAIAFLIAIVLSLFAFDAAFDWNPSIASDDLVIGEWAGRAETLRLASDGTFSYHTPSQTAIGTWTRDDWNLYLRGSYSGTMRFVQYRGSYRLMTHPPDDPDAWNGDLGLQMVKPH